MPNYNADLQAKNAELDAILETVNALPEAAKPETAGSEIIKANGKKTFSPPAGGVFSSFTADVQVPIPPAPVTQEKTVSITSNGTTTITPDVGKLLSKVIAQVNVPTGGGGGGDVVGPFSGIVVNSLTPASEEFRIEQPTLPGKTLAGIAILPAMPCAEESPNGGYIFGSYVTIRNGMIDNAFAGRDSLLSSVLGKKGRREVAFNTAVASTPGGTITKELDEPLCRFQVGKLYYIVGFFN